MLRISISSPQIKGSFPLSLLSLMILNIQGANAEELIEFSSKAAATMPTIKIEAMSELDPIKSYIVKLLYYSYKIRKKLEITHRLSRSTILYAYV
ncbi:iron complex outermembrane recepter protein [Acinetobacter baumannii NIPH 410]|nr:iron complex outermembrane recepter protein [Acinetobacter baumannii NIPH 410]